MSCISNWSDFSGMAKKRRIEKGFEVGRPPFKILRPGYVLRPGNIIQTIQTKKQRNVVDVVDRFAACGPRPQQIAAVIGQIETSDVDRAAGEPGSIITSR